MSAVVDISSRVVVGFGLGLALALARSKIRGRVIAAAQGMYQI